MYLYPQAPGLQSVPYLFQLWTEECVSLTLHVSPLIWTLSSLSDIMSHPDCNVHVRQVPPCITLLFIQVCATQLYKNRTLCKESPVLIHAGPLKNAPRDRVPSFFTCPPKVDVSYSCSHGILWTLRKMDCSLYRSCLCHCASW